VKLKSKRAFQANPPTERIFAVKGNGSMGNRVCRVLLADDHDIIRRGVRTLLETRQDIQVVAEVASGRQAILLARETRPDIAIIDYSMPELNGRDVTLELKREFPRIEVLVYTMHDREDTVTEVLHAGARGFVLKSDPEKHLFAAIDALAVNRPYFSPSVSETLLQQFLRAKPHDDFSILTHREREVVQLIAEGKINKQVAQLLNISVKTVETHRSTVMQKLKLRAAADLVRYAIRNRIIEA
jgi:DNA-binding NarL/FixJ family response regulator